MKINKKKVIGIVLLIIVIGLVIFFVSKNRPNESNNENTITEIETKNTANVNVIDNEISDINTNIVEDKEYSDVEELKKITEAGGTSDIYEVQSEFDGKKVLTVKKSVRFKTAFAGMIKKSVPKQSELDDIFNKYYPIKKGIYIEENSKDKVLELLNDGNNNKYDINSEGYLQIKDKNTTNEIDKKMEKAINGNKTIILNVSSICYVVDDMTGNILDYNFEENDKYQTYEYFEDDDALIIFINENKENQLTKSEILNSMVELF